MIHNLFPIPVGKYPIDHTLTKKQLHLILNLSQRSNQGNTTSENNKILEHKILKTFSDKILEQTKKYFVEVYAPKFEVDLRITQSWINYTNPGQFHHKHSHPNSFISGIYYIQTDKELDRVYFYNDKIREIKLTTDNFNVWNSESWWFEAITGELLLFPSNLSHMVETTKSSQTRVSLSFNTFLVGKIGDDKDLTLLELI